MTTGERIANLRESRDVLQKELAKAIDVDPVVLNRIEKNKRPVRGEELKAIAEYFKVSTDYLLGNESPPDKRLSNEQSDLINDFEELSTAGKNALLFILDSLKKTHSRQTSPIGIVQANIGNGNILTVGDNNSYKT